MHLWQALIPLVGGVVLLVFANRKDPNATPQQVRSGEGTTRQRNFERCGWGLIACTAVYWMSLNLSAQALEPPPWTTLQQAGEFAVDMPDNRSAEEDTIDLGFGEVYSRKWHAPVGNDGHILVRYVGFRRGKAPPQALFLATSEVCKSLRARQFTISQTQTRTIRNCPGAIIDARSRTGRARAMVVVTSQRIYVLICTRLTPEVEKRLFDSFRLLTATKDG